MAAPDSCLSEVATLNFRGNWWIDRAALITPKRAQKDKALPTIFAITGDGQPDLEALNWVRSWLADSRGWQVLVPLKERTATDQHVHSRTSVSPGSGRIMAELIRRVLEDADSPLPSPIEGGRLHLVGLASGSATALAVARRAPQLLASFTCLSGLISAECDLSPLRGIPLLRLYVGEYEPAEHRRGYEAVARMIQAYDKKLLGIYDRNSLITLKAAPSVLFSEAFDFGIFWGDLESARVAARALAPPPRSEVAAFEEKVRRATSSRAVLAESMAFDERFASSTYFQKVRARCPDADELTTASDESLEPGCGREECAESCRRPWGPCDGVAWR